MSILILEKIIEKGSLRWIGQTYESLSPSKTVIAGNSIKDISNAIGFKAYKLGRFSIKNVFIVYDDEDIFYVFVNPNYKDYRKVFKKILYRMPEKVHVDHALSKNLANHFSYSYVLICLVSNVVNMRHGYFEKNKILIESITQVPNVCYSDDRIFDKILWRNPTARRQIEQVSRAYSPYSIPNYGLTLKQKGMWNSAFGFDVVNKPLLTEMISLIF